MKCSTEDAQNRVGRLLIDVELGIDAPTMKIKRQYLKVRELLHKAKDELDILNDMKEEFEAKQDA